MRRRRELAKSKRASKRKMLQKVAVAAVPGEKVFAWMLSRKQRRPRGQRRAAYQSIIKSTSGPVEKGVVVRGPKPP